MSSRFPWPTRVGAPLAIAVWSDGAMVAARREHETVVEPLGFDDVRRLDSEVGPRWVTWSQHTVRHLGAGGAGLTRCGARAAVHRLAVGGHRAEPQAVWARLHGLPPPAPIAGGRSDMPDLFHEHDRFPDPDQPLHGDGALHAGWSDDTPQPSAAHAGVWARLALAAADLQHRWIAESGSARLDTTARSESAIELLCAELRRDGLPIDLTAAEQLLSNLIGPRPATEFDIAAARAAHDQLVLRHAPNGSAFDLRSPGQVRSLLRRVGIEVPDTRAWRLERLVDAHPLIPDLLRWRKLERIATTYGYGWLDQYVAEGPTAGTHRLRGDWDGADGAAGRMTATAGLHNLPRELRSFIAADPGHRFVRADLGQIEPRVLAAISGDPSLIAACSEADLYLPVARRLAVDRPAAKVAMLGAMYGQTTGLGAAALRGLRSSYPVAMAFLDQADAAAQVGTDLFTFGGRRVPMWRAPATEFAESDLRRQAAARGRYGRNAMVQGAAAELFKTWAVTVRARLAGTESQIVLCLHDELLIHAPMAETDRVAAILSGALAEAAHRTYAPTAPAALAVRFPIDLAIVGSWAEAKS